MTDLHPHWHSTGDDDSVTRSPSAAPKAGVRVSVKPAARLPGAIMGIVTFAIIGFTLAGGWEPITAQLGGGSSSASPTAAGSSAAAAPKVQLPPVEIHISPTGFQPASVTVKPGQMITWVNDQSIPHILTSQTLRNGSGIFLNTPAIFPGGRESFTVGEKETDREHIVVSATDQTLRGTVIVSSKDQSASSSVASRRILGGTDGIDLPSGEGKKTSNSGGPVKKTKSSSSKAVKATTSKSSSRSSGTAAAAGTTTTPGDGSAQVFPPDPTGTPTPIGTFTPESMGAANGVNVPLSQPLNSYAPPNPQPNEQPHTGPGLWIVAFISLAVLWGISRKYLVRPTF